MANFKRKKRRTNAKTVAETRINCSGHERYCSWCSQTRKRKLLYKRLPSNEILMKELTKE